MPSSVWPTREYRCNERTSRDSAEAARLTLRARVLLIELALRELTLHGGR